MAIDDNIQRIIDLMVAEALALQEDPLAPTPVSTEVQTKAKAAIHGGVEQFVAYMRLFAQNDAELARLLPLENPLDADRQEARAYLVRNGTCGQGTGRMTLDNVAGRL